MRCSYLWLLTIPLLGLTAPSAEGRLFGGRPRCCRSVEAPTVAAADAIFQVLIAQEAAWNHGDLEGFMAGYWKSPELTFLSGDKVTLGWQPTHPNLLCDLQNVSP